MFGYLLFHLVFKTDQDVNGDLENRVYFGYLSHEEGPISANSNLFIQLFLAQLLQESLNRLHNLMKFLKPLHLLKPLRLTVLPQLF